MAKQSEPQKMTKTEKMVDDLVQKAHQALDIMSEFDQKKVDYITHQMVEAGQDKHMELAIEASRKPVVGSWKIRRSRICLRLKKFGTTFARTTPLG